MRFNSMLVSTFLFASIALAVPSQFHHQNLVQKRENASSDLDYNSSWAGAMYTLNSGSFDYISGTITVPHTSRPTNTSVIVKVGINGTDSCPIPFGAGVLVFVTQGGPVLNAWLEFNGNISLPNVTVSAGHLIRVTLNALNETSSLAVVENLSNGQKDRRELTSSDPLCMQTAGWAVEVVHGPNGSYPVPDFNVTFTDAVALGKSGQYYGPQGANTSEIITSDGRALTRVSLGKGSVTIGRV